MAWPCVPGTTARSRCTDGWACRRRVGRVCTCTIPNETSTRWCGACMPCASCFPPDRRRCIKRKGRRRPRPMALDDLYREVILDHYTHPRNKGTLADADIKVEGANPLCGDELGIYVHLTDGKVASVRFEGRGGSISQASASMMTEQIKRKTLTERRALVERFRAMMHGGAASEEDLGGLIAVQGGRQISVRIHFATLGLGA